MKTVKIMSTFELLKRFPNNEVAIKYLENLQWSNGVFCIRCKERKRICKRKIGNYFCGGCHKSFNIKTNTLMQCSHIGAHIWLYTMYLFVTGRKGISSLQLSKEIGITQKSAWFLLHRVRRACKQNLNLLSGIVEIGETYIGGREKSRHETKKIPNSQGGANKDIVMGFKERNGKVKAHVIPNVQYKTLKDRIDTNIEKGATICTDELKGYNSITDYTHLKVNHSAKEFVNGMASVNGVESFWALLKRGYHGTYHNFSTKHLSRYVNEFVFRQNEGNCNTDTLDRIKALCILSRGKYLSYKSLIKPSID